MTAPRDLRNVFVTYNPDQPRTAFQAMARPQSPSPVLGPRPEHGGVTPNELDDAAMAELFIDFGKALAEIKHAQGPESEPGILSTADDAMAGALQGFLSITSRPETMAPLPNGIGQEVAIDDKDFSGWIRSFFTWYKGIRKHRWLPLPTTLETLPEVARVAVLGDWGTGLYGAPQIAKLMDEDPRGYDLAIHLGDVYYSGLQEEVQQRFLNVWPQKPKVSRALNSNHEMYTGGYGYFDLTLPKFKQSSSAFAMANEHFLLVGLDTGYDEHDLAHGQATWLDGLLAGAGQRKVILFSHHQPFSIMEKQGPKLVKKLERLLTEQRIFAWFWGHEHRCMIYDIHPTWQLRGRLVGHSGYPYFRKGAVNSAIELTVGTDSTWRRLPGNEHCPSGLLLDGPNPFVPVSPEKYGPNGWAALELNGPQAIEVYYNAQGQELWRKPLA